MKVVWEHKKLGDVCLHITDGTHITPTYTKDGIPFLSVKNLTQGIIDFSDTRFISREEHDFLTRRYKPVRDDILYTKVGTTGIAKVVDVDDEFSIFVSVALLKIKHEIIFNRYLEYFLNSPYAREQAQKRTRGMANRNLVISDIKQIDIHYPASILEQRRIVGILDETFAGIAKTKGNAEKNLQNARTLFESHRQTVFAKRSPGRVENRLADVCVLQRGFDLPTRSRVAGKYQLVSSSGIIDTHNEGPVKGPGVATGRSGSIGNVFYIEDDYWPLNTVLYVKDFHGNDPKFVYHLLNHFDLKRFSTGAGVPTLNRNFVHDEWVVIPESTTSQIQIAEQMDSLFAETQRLESIYKRKLAALDELKKSLLHQAFTGQL